MKKTKLQSEKSRQRWRSNLVQKHVEKLLDRKTYGNKLFEDLMEDTNLNFITKSANRHYVPAKITNR